MPTSATWTIQAAIVTLLRADPTLAGLSLTEGVSTVGIYNDIPENTGYPHVLVTKATETAWHALGGTSQGFGWKNIIRIHVYSHYQGDKEALKILERVITLLNFQTLIVTGYSSVIVEYEQMRVMLESIEKIETRHIVGEFVVRVQQ